MAQVIVKLFASKRTQNTYRWPMLNEKAIDIAKDLNKLDLKASYG